MSETDLNIHWVRVMCDYCAEGLWDDEGAPLSPDVLPLSDGLKRQILSWQDDFERLSDDTETEFQDFCVKGLQIATRIKGELPDWTVIYHDPRRYPKPSPKTAAEIEAVRSQFEYEIVL